MQQSSGWEALTTITVGILSVDALRMALEAQGVQLNERAETLLARDEMATPVVTLDLVTSTPAALGFPEGATLPNFYDAAIAAGLQLCPLATGAYLRLVHQETESLDPELHRHRPPDESLTVASPILDPSFEVPKGFYLRTVDGVRWLRGHRCDDEYVLPPSTVFVFALPHEP